MNHESKKEWVKPELKVISFAKTNETVLVVSIQKNNYDSYEQQQK